MRIAQRKFGWIGVDIGTTVVKIAQVARYKQGWRIAASAVVPRQQAWETDPRNSQEVASTLNELQAARSLQQGYRGRSVAAALPMALCDVHRLDRDLSTEANPSQILRQAIETATQQSVEQVQCDYWSAPQSENQPAWTQAIMAPRNWTEQLCEDIVQAGWNCKAIDGLPLAITRAVGMVTPEATTSSVAALDWGTGRATLCFIENGQPSYVRCLKDCGLGTMLETLIESLQVTELEAQRLLEEHALAASAKMEQNDVAKLVQEALSEPLGRLIEEIKRSFSHYQYVRRSSAPKQLYLFGGGAMIDGIENYLSKQLEVEAQRWQLPPLAGNQSSADRRADCLLASAIGLSALAWESS